MARPEGREVLHLVRQAASGRRRSTASNTASAAFPRAASSRCRRWRRWRRSRDAATSRAKSSRRSPISTRSSWPSPDRSSASCSPASLRCSCGIFGKPEQRRQHDHDIGYVVKDTAAEKAGLQAGRQDHDHRRQAGAQLRRPGRQRALARGRQRGRKHQVHDRTRRRARSTSWSKAEKPEQDPNLPWWKSHLHAPAIPRGRHHRPRIAHGRRLRWRTSTSVRRRWPASSRTTWCWPLNGTRFAHHPGSERLHRIPSRQAALARNPTRRAKSMTVTGRLRVCPNSVRRSGTSP